jgi:hypothetical protein
MVTMRRHALLALFLLPLGCAERPLLEPDTALRPACLSPAPLDGSFDARAPGYIVSLHRDYDLDSTIEFLSARYDFAPVHIYRLVLHGFSADFSPETVAELRCEPSVSMISHNGILTAV